MPGTAVIVQGDSRRLGEVLERAWLCLSSPPYTSRTVHGGDGIDWEASGAPGGRSIKADYGQTAGNLGNLPDTGFEAALALGSPPYIGSIREGKPGIDIEKLGKAGPNSQARIMNGYGSGPGQLAQMPEGSFDLALSSPPFQSTYVKGGETKGFHSYDKDEAYNRCKRDYDIPQSDGQLAALPTGDHAAALEAGAETGRAELCLSSPPWETSDVAHNLNAANREKFGHVGSVLAGQTDEYGQTEGQMGNETGSTFWAASRQILEEVYKVLAPGGHAIWVLKMFVRSGRLVDFPGQWEALCQSVGFHTVCKHRAWMNKNADIMQITLDGDEVSMEKWYKSFFRILCEKKGAPRIDWELILCMEKPQ